VPPRAAALAGFAVLAAVVWAGELGADAYVGLTAAACVSAALITLRAPAWAYAGTFVVWVVAVALLVGLGSPSNWGDPALGGAWSLLAGRVSSPDAHVGVGVVVLWVSGGLLIAGALAAARGRRLAALACVATPWVVAVSLGYGGDAAWEGGAVVALAALWLFDQQEVLARRVFGAAAVAGVAVAVVAPPDDSWLKAIAHASDQPPTRRFDPTQTYGALHGERNGTVLARIRSPRDSYWRMRALDVVDSRGWRTATLRSPPPLPEPRAHREDAAVEIRALRSSYAIGPGRIESVPSGGVHVPLSGDSWRLIPTPVRGDRYHVRAVSVHPSWRRLERAPLPTDPGVRDYLRIGDPGGFWAAPAAFGAPRDPGADAELRSHGYARTLALARRLAAGAGTQAELVRRVKAFLASYRYSTDAADHRRPLDAFLFKDRAGSCQHFAGAAALLLRLAGVPARVAVGFAPGVAGSDGHWVIHDRDAHAWVEVWYQGLGWVVFDPTPRAANAAALSHSSAAALLVGCFLLASAPAVWRRRPRGTGEGLLVQLARQGEDVATLRESAAVLGRTIGPRTADLALAAEQARYGQSGARPPRRQAVIRAVCADRSPIGAIAVLARLVVRS
jgi:protein-glutamine gamma-glutamyltransferase